MRRIGASPYIGQFLSMAISQIVPTSDPIRPPGRAVLRRKLYQQVDVLCLLPSWEIRYVRISNEIWGITSRSKSVAGLCGGDLPCLGPRLALDAVTLWMPCCNKVPLVQRTGFIPQAQTAMALRAAFGTLRSARRDVILRLPATHLCAARYFASGEQQVCPLCQQSS